MVNLEVVWYLDLQLRLQHKSFGYLHQCLQQQVYKKSFLEVKTTLKSNISHKQKNMCFSIFKKINLLEASSTSLNLIMISFQSLQVCLEKQRLLMSNLSRIFFKISFGKTWLIIGNPSLAASFPSKFSILSTSIL